MANKGLFTFTCRQYYLHINPGSGSSSLLTVELTVVAMMEQYILLIEKTIICLQFVFHCLLVKVFSG